MGIVATVVLVGATWLANGAGAQSAVGAQLRLPDETYPAQVCAHGLWLPESSGPYTCSPTSCSNDGQSCPSTQGCAKWKSADCKLDPGNPLAVCTLTQHAGEPPKLICVQLACELEGGVIGYKCKWEIDYSSDCDQVNVGGKRCK